MKIDPASAVREVLFLIGMIALGVGLWWVKPAIALITLGSILILGTAWSRFYAT